MSSPRQIWNVFDVKGSMAVTLDKAIEGRRENWLSAVIEKNLHAAKRRSILDSNSSARFIEASGTS